MSLDQVVAPLYLVLLVQVVLQDFLDNQVEQGHQANLDSLVEMVLPVSLDNQVEQDNQETMVHLVFLGHQD